MFFQIINGGFHMGRKSKVGKLNWRSKKANHGRKPCKG